MALIVVRKRYFIASENAVYFYLQRIV